jgi:DNA-binding response OmpR family regulator
MRILVIDDDPEIREMLKQLLTPLGHEIDLAVDGQDGMRKYQERIPDLVITDLYMPNQEGVETIIQLRKRCPGARIIAMSGRFAEGAMLSVARRAGAAVLLQKPFLPDELRRAVDVFLPVVGCA